MMRSPARALSRRRRILFSIVLAVCVLLVLELTARVYLRRFDRGVLVHPERVIYGFYPELKSVSYERRHETREDVVEVLLLGGSVLSVEWTAIEALLAERLTRETRRPVRVYNLAEAAHTTRDSLLKYQRLDGSAFDLVVIYHGINETRTNNAPPDVFRDDYGHYSWYRFVNAIDRDRWLEAVALPYFFKHASIILRDRLGLSEVVPTSDPRPEWLEYGKDVKSAGPFRENLTAILDRARTRGEPVLLMTFASNIPDGYSNEKFEALELGIHQAPFAPALVGPPRIRGRGDRGPQRRHPQAGRGARDVVRRSSRVDSARGPPLRRRVPPDGCRVAVIRRQHDGTIAPGRCGRGTARKNSKRGCSRRGIEVPACDYSLIDFIDVRQGSRSQGRGTGARRGPDRGPC